MIVTLVIGGAVTAYVFGFVMGVICARRAPGDGGNNGTHDPFFSAIFYD